MGRRDRARDVEPAFERWGGEQEPWPIRAFESTRVRVLAIVVAVLLATRDARRSRTYFPTVELMAP